MSSYFLDPKDLNIGRLLFSGMAMTILLMLLYNRAYYEPSASRF